MKALNHAYDKVVAFENLHTAWKKARKGKKDRSEVAAFEFNLEYSLLSLQEELIQKTYKPGPYRLFTIYENKPRQIAAAPFRDRVVHHALMNIVEPFIDRKLIYDCYACRKNKGVHKAVKRYQQWARKYPYVLKMDVRRYFPSIDQTILQRKLAAVIHDTDMLELFNKILLHAPEYPQEGNLKYFADDDLFSPLYRRCGIPIGNLTSQVLANWYLNDLDHYIKQQLKIKAYLRYVDDLFILSDNKHHLHQVKEAISHQVMKERLRMHPNKSHVMPVNVGVDVLGYFVFPYSIRLRNSNGHRFHRKLKKFADAYTKGRMELDDITPRVHSWIGHAQHADTEGLRKVLFDGVSFTRESV